MFEAREPISEVVEIQIKQAIINFMKYLKVNVNNNIEIQKEQDCYTYSHTTARKKQFDVLLFDNVVSYIQWSRINKNKEKDSKIIFGYYVVLLDKQM